MTTYGLTADGFVRKRLPDILEELKQAYRDQFGDDALLDGESVLGELIGIQAEREAKLWELAETVYFSAYPDTADGVSLAYAGGFTGHAPLSAQFSTTTVTCSTVGASPVTLSVGRQVKVPATGATFETITEVVIPAGGSVDVAVRAIATGPLEAPAGTLTGIVTPVSGWDAVTNAADAEVGRNPETDTEFRQRRRDTLTISRGGIINAMKARIPELVDGVTYCAVSENRTSVTDGDGVPPHSVHVLVIGGTDANVAQAIWDTKPGGANTFGTESAVIVDSFGNNQTVYFDRGTDLRIYLIANLTTDADYPAGGDALVTAQLAAFDDTLDSGDDVLNWKLVAALSGIAGITGVEILQGTSPAPASSANTTVGASQRARIAAADITVNS